MEFFQINIMVGIVGSDRCNVAVIFHLTFWLKYCHKTVIVVFDRGNVPLILLMGVLYYQLPY